MTSHSIDRDELVPLAREILRQEAQSLEAMAARLDGGLITTPSSSAVVDRERIRKQIAQLGSFIKPGDPAGMDCVAQLSH